MRRRAAWLALVLAAAPAAAAVADRCAAPAEFRTAAGPLRNAAAAIAASGRLEILVLGSGSTTLGGTSAVANLYPAQMQAALAPLLAGVELRVTTRGGRGLSAADMLKLLREALRQDRPRLVIWQTGTVDAVRGLDPDVFLATIAAGAGEAAEAKADVVLMDMQFSRAGRATVNFGPYRDAMQTLAATAENVVLFRRYELMRHWAEEGRIDLERAPRADWAKEADRLHACLGKVLAATIAEGLRLAR
ncbi:hypothetical protein [Elioraea sp.]|jgi:lysophospholipase L1-like esterase|uniref:hypothetical protein n=1 Tax=Elioraea sp. TaxID=2185103 RepID=UPI0021DF221A|nr:hypothetical protein [Elioraea sp.]GIX11658.1 MAG: hypothetical protein KatS3mg116_3368 [Elioraea sp.]